jgi:hypothetical protein
MSHSPSPRKPFPPPALNPADLVADLLHESRRLHLDDVPLPAIAGDVFRLADCAGWPLANPDASAGRRL